MRSLKRKRRSCTAFCLIIAGSVICISINILLLSTTAMAFIPTVSSILAPNKNLPWQCYRCRFLLLNNKNDIGNDDFNGNDTTNVDSVSDEDALLAVRAYLVRKKRLQWKAGEERKQRRQQYQASMADATSLQQPTTGFFWEDPNQLPYLTTTASRSSSSNRRRRKRLLAASTGTNSSMSSDYDLLDDESSSSAVATPETRMTNELVDDEDDDDEDDEDLAATALWESGQNPEETLDEWETIVNTPETVQQVRQLVDDDDDDDDDDDNEGIPEEKDDEFSAIDGTPSPSFLRRSTAARRRWSDPVWKAQWYEKRWGSNNSPIKQVSSSKQQQQQQQQRRKQYQPLTFDAEAFLASPEMAQLTPDEIAQAIQSYMHSKEKRQKSREQTRLQRQAQIAWDSSCVLSSNDPDGKDSQKETTAIERDSLFQPNPDELLARQKQRSERAKRAYQTRLEKQQSGNKQKMAPRKPNRKRTTTTTTTTIPTSASRRTTTITTTSPHTALLQIQAALNANQFPAHSDVECILLPHRLSQRKQVLLRILNDCFDLRGKCVPVQFLGADSDVDNTRDAENGGECAFVTHCPVHAIGDFVLYKLKQLEEE